MKSGLEGLEGVKSVKQESFKSGKGVYAVTVDEKKSVTWKKLEDAIGSFTLDLAELTLVGDAEKTDKGLCLTARGSGAKLCLVNRAKKSDEKEAPDVVGKIEGFLKEGTKTVKVSGQLKAEKDDQIVHLDAAEAVKK